MAEYFMSKITVKKIVIIKHERFTPEGFREPVEVRPISLESMSHMGDLSHHTLYLFPTSTDRQTGIFRVFLTDR